MQIALFHSVLGVRPGVLFAADMLRAAGHSVQIVDQYEGRVFDDYPTASAYAEGQLGFAELTDRALRAVADAPDDLVVAGFSNGGGMAEWVATHRPVAAAVLMSGVLPLALLRSIGPVDGWPSGVPAQTHYMRGDPFLQPGSVDAFAAEVEQSGGTVEQHWYDGTGHLFTDASLPAEYDASAAKRLWEAVDEFLARL